ncbi:MAG: ATP-binding cassette domain-containing protein [Acidobacteria bacterium]|nr:ATP-binding cassette domain-containing protein [Acidobacteriota bacterium]
MNSSGSGCRQKGRHAKSKARINDYEKLVAEESEKRNERLSYTFRRRSPRRRRDRGARRFEGLRRQAVVREPRILAPEGRDRRRHRSPNGAGKTTLFQADHRKGNGGLRRLQSRRNGQTRLCRSIPRFARRKQDDLGRDRRRLDVVQLGKREMNSRAYVSRFNFSGTDQQKRVGQLSGGERNRVHLAKMLKSGANVLLLDEPTNDLDVNTMRALEEALENFGGCAVVISHDRWFLDRIATHILAFEGDSRVVYFDGNFSQYEEDRKRRLGHDADQPHRIKYRNLTRD